MSVQLRGDTYVITCDQCGEQIIWLTNDEEGMYSELAEKGWKISDDKALCPDCASGFINH